MKLSTSFLYLFAAEFFFYVSGYVVHMGAGRMLGPQEYGRYGLVITITLLVANLIGSGIPIAMGKILSEAAAKNLALIPSIRRKSAQAQTLFIGVVTGVYLLIAPLLASLVSDRSLTSLFLFSAFIIPCYALDSYYFYYYSGIKRFGVQSTLKFLRSFLRVTIILALTYLFHLKGIIAGYIFVPLLVFVVAVFLDRKSRVIKENEMPESSFHPRQLIALGLPVTIFLVLFELLMSFDLYLLKAITHDDHMAGWYNAALTLARTPTFLFYALTLILLPTIAESVSQENKERTKHLILSALRFMIMLTVPVTILFITYRESILTLFFGESFRGAASFFPALLIGTSAFAFLYVFGFAYKGAGKVLTPIVFCGLALISNGLLDFLFLSFGRVEFLSYGKALAALTTLPFFLSSLAKTFHTSLDIRELAVLSILGTLLFGAASFTGDTKTALFVAGPVLLLLYGGALYWTGLITPDDWQILLKKETH